MTMSNFIHINDNVGPVRCCDNCLGSRQKLLPCLFLDKNLHMSQNKVLPKQSRPTTPPKIPRAAQPSFMSVCRVSND